MLNPEPLTPLAGAGTPPCASVGPGRFALLGGCPALAPRVEQFNALLERRGTSREAAPGCTEHRLADVEPSQDGTLRLGRLHLSVQSGGTGGPFIADTYLQDRQDGALDHWRFPVDRGLPGAASAVERLRGGGLRVLRYLPMRRLTLLGAPPGGDGRCLRTEIVEPGAAAGTFGRLRAVQAAFGAASFRVANVLDVQASAGIITLGCLSGTPLEDFLVETSLVPTFERLGSVHREIHDRLPPTREASSAQGFFTQVRERLRWLGLLNPERHPFFAAVERCLAARFPRAGASAFCHGNFGPSHVLADGEDWSVTDFDDCCIADRHWECGRLLARLRCEVGPIAERLRSDTATGGEWLRQAETAYLAGYESAGTRLDPARLRWYRTCCEVLQLAQGIRRDLVSPQTFEDACCRIETLCLEAIE